MIIYSRIRDIYQVFFEIENKVFAMIFYSGFRDFY